MYEDKIEKGMKVRSADGHQLGKITECRADGFLIEKGFFFPKERLASFDSIESVRDGEVWLREHREQLAPEPAASAPPAAAETAGEQRMPLVEEELTVGKHMEEVGDVRVRKEAYTETQRIDVPVTKEEVIVETAPASGAATGEIGKGETLRIPVREERVDVSKEPVVTEEVRVKKTERVETEPVTAELKKEQAVVEKTGAVREKEARPQPSLEDEEARRAGH